MGEGGNTKKRVVLFFAELEPNTFEDVAVRRLPTPIGQDRLWAPPHWYVSLAAPIIACSQHRVLLRRTSNVPLFTLKHKTRTHIHPQKHAHTHTHTQTHTHTPTPTPTPTHTHLGIHPAATNLLEIKHCLMYHSKINFQGFRGQSELQADSCLFCLQLYMVT